MTYFDFLDDLYPEWHARAECNGMDPAIWFPSTPGGRKDFTRKDAARQAIAICARCPVQRQCAEERDKYGERYGIWAGVDLEATEADDAA